MSTLIAVPVHERPHRVRWCLATLADMQLPADARIVVFDDHSTSFDPAEMLAEMGLAADCERQPFRLGADAMIYRIWSSFLAGADDHLLMLDSDMIVNRTALIDGLRLLAEFEGLLSLYNSMLHPVLGQSGDLVYKHKLGNAGTLWRRDMVQLIYSQLKPGNHLDDRYCDFLRRRGLPMASTARSRLQHLGFEGQNNRFYGALEHGIGFVPDSAAQRDALVAAYDELMSRQDHFTAGKRQPWRLGPRR